MTLVVDALVDGGPSGRWAESALCEGALAAPQLMPAEVANVLRRAWLAGRLPADSVAMAHADLLDLRVELFPYEVVAERVWELRQSVTAYDAWYVALAEALEAPLATLDQRLVRAPGPRCTFATPRARARD